MDAPKTVSANFVAFKLGKKVTLNKERGTAKLTVQAGGPGTVVLSGKKVKKSVKKATGKRPVKIPVLARGKGLATLLATGKVKVLVKVTYTPTGGAPVAQLKKLTPKAALPK